MKTTGEVSQGEFSQEHVSSSFPSEHNPTLENPANAIVANSVAETVSVDTSLSRALTKAAEAGRFDVVAQLARELEARRLAGSNVVPLSSSSRKGGAK